MALKCLPIFTSICLFQLIFIIEREIFDFLGRQWSNILINFISILISILAIFAICSIFRCKFLIVYIVWQLCSIVWNSFLIIFYLKLWSFVNTGDYNIINLWTGSRSWWETNGPNCHPSYNYNSTDVIDIILMKPTSVTGCYISYEYIEVMQASITIMLAFIGSCLSLHLMYLYYKSNEDDTFIQKQSMKNSRMEHVSNVLPPYSITIQSNSRRSSTRSTRSTRSRRSHRRKSLKAQSKLSQSARNLSSSIESFNNAHLNPLYNHYSRGSRYSLYTISSQRRSPIYMNTETMI